MQKVEIKFLRKNSQAILPSKNNINDSGYDIYSIQDKIIPAGKSGVVSTGIDVAYITNGYWFKIQARSGLGFKYSISPHYGIIDNGYRGDLGVKIYNKSDKDYYFKKGDRIAQFVIYKLYESEVSWSDIKHNTARGENGIGSSGK